MTDSYRDSTADWDPQGSLDGDIRYYRMRLEQKLGDFEGCPYRRNLSCGGGADAEAWHQAWVLRELLTARHALYLAALRGADVALPAAMSDPGLHGAREVVTLTESALSRAGPGNDPPPVAPTLSPFLLSLAGNVSALSPPCLLPSITPQEVAA